MKKSALLRQLWRLYLKGLHQMQMDDCISNDGHGQPQDLKRTADAGFAGHLVKPIDTDELNSLMQNLYAESTDSNSHSE